MPINENGKDNASEIVPEEQQTSIYTSKQERDIDAQEFKKSYFKAMWAISVKSNSLYEAILGIFESSLIKAQINSPFGLNFNLMKRALVQSGGYSENDIEKELLRAFLKKTTYRINRSAQAIYNVVPTHNTVLKPKPNMNVGSLRPEIFTKELKLAGYELLDSAKCGEILTDIVKEYSSFSNQDVNNIMKELFNKYGHNKSDSNTILKLMLLTRTNFSINENSRFTFLKRLLRSVFGAVLKRDLKVLVEEMFMLDYDNLPKRSKDNNLV